MWIPRKTSSATTISEQVRPLNPQPCHMLPIMCASDEKVYDYQMTHKKFKEINIANLLAEAEYEARIECQRLKDQDWVHTLNNYAATVMQGM